MQGGKHEGGCVGGTSGLRGEECLRLGGTRGEGLPGSSRMGRIISSAWLWVIQSSLEQSP